jgi:hypothetical protein
LATGWNAATPGTALPSAASAIAVTSRRPPALDSSLVC